MSDVLITGIGAVTPVGAGAAQTCASIRGGLTGLSRHPTYYPIPPAPLTEPPERIACGLAAGSPDALDPAARVLRMATAAVRDLVRSAGLRRAEAQKARVFLCLSGPDRGGFTAGQASALAELLPRRLGLALARTPELILEAQPGGLLAAAEGARGLAAGEVERCIVLAADTFVHDDTLRALDERERLRSARTLDGFLPGEGAACFLLERRDAAERRGAEVLARLSGVGSGREPNTVAGDANSTARGLCEAIRGALDGARVPVGWTVCDLNGERYRAYEWGVARARLGSLLGDIEVSHPADCTGDTGSVAGALAIVVAAHALAKGYAPSDGVLIWAAANGQQRAACTLTALRR